MEKSNNTPEYLNFCSIVPLRLVPVTACPLPMPGTENNGFPKGSHCLISDMF
jgi:hypothetical protein